MKKILSAILMFLSIASCSTSRDGYLKRPLDLRGPAETTTNNRK